MKKLPVFKNEDNERDFWAKHELSDVFDEKKAQVVVFSNLKPSSKTITLRLPTELLETIKVEANKRDVPYQSYIKVKLSEVFRTPRQQSI